MSRKMNEWTNDTKDIVGSYDKCYSWPCCYAKKQPQHDISFSDNRNHFSSHNANNKKAHKASISAAAPSRMT